MNSIMSGALPNHYPFRGTTHVMSNSSSRPSSSACLTPTSPQSPFDFIDRIPSKEVELSNETLGSGSFGTVFKGRWRGKKVAVKQFKTREERDSFLVEVKQLSCVKHPNIVVLYGAITLPDTAYLIMEYSEGGSLSNLLHECKKQEYDLRHACSWAKQTARGVAYLHGIRPKPIMHRDLKPANLLLFQRGRILKICDFGTACDVKTQMTNNTGSPSYMAPEVFATSSYLESGDVFSWGIIFWEILVRLHPYNQPYSNPFQILWSVNQGARPTEIDHCPKHIWNLITRSWDKDPKKRPSMQFIAEEMHLIYQLVDGSCNNQRRTPDGVDKARHQDHQAGRCDNNSSSSNIIRSPDQIQQWTTTSISPSPQPQTSSHYYHNNNHHQSHQLLSREHSIQDETLRAIRTKALKHRIETLQESSKRLEEGSKCDKMDKDVSFTEFEKLKVELKIRRRYMSTLNSQQHKQQQQQHHPQQHHHPQQQQQQQHHPQQQHPQQQQQPPQYL
uniref:Mitogen-activated protein kinase kinase kinase 7 n=2 Tax=Aceria tosichella TaxID=561515 RepID=A0A6G1SLS7_9ACAR